jgi:hypothetical protein
VNIIEKEKLGCSIQWWYIKFIDAVIDYLEKCFNLSLSKRRRQDDICAGQAEPSTFVNNQVCLDDLFDLVDSVRFSNRVSLNSAFY